MKNSLDITPNLNRKLDLANFGYNEMRCILNNQDSLIQNIGSGIEEKRLELIVDLIQKRKKVRDIAIQRLDELIIYCDNKILELGGRYIVQTDMNLKGMAARWQQTILELEKSKIGENKELFRDTLFLRNEWIKSLLDYTEEKKLDEMINKMI